MKNFSELWNKTLITRQCGGYYDAVPCRAQSSNVTHSYCKTHVKLLVKRAQETQA